MSPIFSNLKATIPQIIVTGETRQPSHLHFSSLPVSFPSVHSLWRLVSGPGVNHLCTSVNHFFIAQVANTRPTSGIWPSTLFYLAWHLVSTWQQRRAPTSLLRSSCIYTVLKLHLALWRQPWGWCGSWWKWFWHPWSKGSYKIVQTMIASEYAYSYNRETTGKTLCNE